MNDSQTIATLVITGVLVSLGLAGMLTAQTAVDRCRQQTLVAVAAALALAVTGRMHGHSALDLWSWIIVATTLIPLWPRRQTPAAPHTQSLTPNP